MLLDLKLPDMTGFEVLERTREQRPVVIMVTGHGDVSLAVQAMQAGAEGFLTKPVELAHLGAVVDRALEKAQLRDLSRAAGARLGRVSTDMLLGSSSPMRELAQQIELLARSERTVALLVGESGRGQGARGAGDPRAERARRPRLPRDRLLDAAGGGAGPRAVRRRAQRRRSGPGTVRGGRRRHALPRRDRRAARRAAADAAPRDRVAPRAPHRAARARCSVDVRLDRRDDARPRDRGDGGTIPRGSLLPARRDAAPSAAAARPLAGGRARDGAGAGGRAAPRRARRAARGSCGRAGADRLVPVAGQRARAAQRARARAAPRARRSRGAAAAPAGRGARRG